MHYGPGEDNGWSLMTIAIVAFLLCYSTYKLLMDPQALFRYFGAGISFFQFVLLISIGLSGLIQSIGIDSDIDIFCRGGFPKMGVIGKNYVFGFLDVEHHLIKNHMCMKDACPCSIKINQAKYGNR